MYHIRIPVSGTGAVDLRHMRTTLARKRRGESTIIANLILFISVMGMAATVVAVFKTMLDDSTSAAAREKQRAVNVMQTSFTIPSASYSAGTVFVYVKNTGDASFDPDDMDIYLDGIRIPRNATNRTVQVTADTDLSDVGTWDPGEELEFNVFITYPVPASHDVTVYSSNGVSAENIFSS